VGKITALLEGGGAVEYLREIPKKNPKKIASKTPSVCTKIKGIPLWSAFKGVLMRKPPGISQKALGQAVREGGLMGSHRPKIMEKSHQIAQK
jgi:hypothetical protein